MCSLVIHFCQIQIASTFWDTCIYKWPIIQCMENIINNYCNHLVLVCWDILGNGRLSLTLSFFNDPSYHKSSKWRQADVGPIHLEQTVRKVRVQNSRCKRARYQFMTWGLLIRFYEHNTLYIMTMFFFLLRNIARFGCVFCCSNSTFRLFGPSSGSSVYLLDILDPLPRWWFWKIHGVFLF